MIAYGGDVMSEPERVHTPVLLSEVVSHFTDEHPDSVAGWVVDGTLGAGGHSRALLETYPNIKVFGLDQDPEVLSIAQRELASFEGRVLFARGRFSRLFALLKAAGIESAIGVLFDLGANSLHFDQADRGFSFAADGPLDMRMDPDRRRTAADIVNSWDEEDLADLFYHEGGEKNSRRIAHAIVQARRRVPFMRTAALAETISTASGRKGGRIHPATRSFQALRRAVNEEAEELLHGLKVAERILERLDAPFAVGGTRVRVSASIGVAFSPTAVDDPDGLVREADQAMYQAKRAGRSRVVVSSEGVREDHTLAG